MKKKLRYRHFLFFLVPLLLISCKKEKGPASQEPPVMPVPAVLVKDMVLSHLPSPYYHFEYNAAGRPSFVSFASGFTMYNIGYSGDRISEMKNNTAGNKDRLQYVYDNEGRVSVVKCADSTGIVHTSYFLSYDGQKLIELKRERKLGAGFIIDKTLTMLYHADGNLREITEHRPPINGQSEINFTDRFEQYDDKINVDGFSLIHNDFFEHLVLLPGVLLQKNNPRKLTRTGDGINFHVDYTYTYNGRNAPLTIRGEGIWSEGTETGRRFQVSAVFSYY